MKCREHNNGLAAISDGNTGAFNRVVQCVCGLIFDHMCVWCTWCPDADFYAFGFPRLVDWMDLILNSYVLSKVVLK